MTTPNDMDRGAGVAVDRAVRDNLAPFDARALAYVIDAVLATLVSSSVLAIPLALQSDKLDRAVESMFEGDTEVMEALIPSGVWIAAAVAPLLISIVMLGLWGATPGKLIMRLRVRRFVDGERIAWSSAVARVVVPAAPELLLMRWMGVSNSSGSFVGALLYATALWDRELRRGLPDLAAGTIVLRLPRPPVPPPPVLPPPERPPHGWPPGAGPS